MVPAHIVPSVYILFVGGFVDDEHYDDKSFVRFIDRPPSLGGRDPMHTFRITQCCRPRREDITAKLQR